MQTLYSLTSRGALFAFVLCARIRPRQMVRPRASENNVRAAIAFADIVVKQTVPGHIKDASTVLVARKGKYSVFSMFAACFPQLVRDARDKRPQNRRGIAVLELNKALHSLGLKSLRKRNRSEEGVRWSSKVWNSRII